MRALKTYWLSFCDPDKPAGEQFLGVAIVEAEPGSTDRETVARAIRRAWALNINPGGEVMTTCLPDDSLHLIPATARNRLLSKEEAEDVGRPQRVQ